MRKVDGGAFRRSKRKKNKVHESKETDSDAATKSETKEMEDNEEIQTSWSKTFGWQEKVFGPHEIVEFSNTSESDSKESGILNWMAMMSRRTQRSTVVEKVYRDHFDQLSKSGVEPKDSVESTMLFTYTDKDRYEPAETKDSLITSARLGDNSLSGRSRQDRASHISREASLTTMYIMVGFCDSESLRTKEKGDLDFREHLLCSIRHHSDRTQLDVQPGFYTGDVDDDESASSDSNMLLRLDDAHRAHSRGWIRFENPRNGEEYEYRVTNASATPKDESVGKSSSSPRVPAKKNDDSDGRSTRRPTGHLERSPPKGYTRVHAFLELVSAHAFGGDTLFVRYDVLLPNEGYWFWAPEEASKSTVIAKKGVTQRVRPKMMWSASRDHHCRDFVAHFCFPIELEFLRANGPKEAANNLVRGEESAEEDDDGRSPVEQGSPTAAQRNDRATKIDRSDEALLKGDDDEEEDASPQGGKGMSNSLPAPKRSHVLSERPQIVFQVFARDPIGRIYTKGYGHFILPLRPGIHETFVATWKPEGSIKDNMSNFLLGGQRQVDDLSYVSIPRHVRTSSGDGLLNKFGFACKSSGRLRLRLNLMHQSEAPPKQKMEKPKPKRRPSAIRRSTGDILAALRKSRQLLSTVGSPKVRREPVVSEAPNTSAGKPGASDSRASDGPDNDTAAPAFDPYKGKQAEHQLQASVGFSLLCTLVGIPFSLTCVKIYYQDNAEENLAAHKEELNVMRNEWKLLEAHAKSVDNDIASLCTAMDSEQPNTPTVVPVALTNDETCACEAQK
eukprot:g1062.t1